MRHARGRKLESGVQKNRSIKPKIRWKAKGLPDVWQGQHQVLEVQQALNFRLPAFRAKAASHATQPVPQCLSGNAARVFLFSVSDHGPENVHSPVLDMRRLIENMMGWFGVTQERLCRERAIETPTGETLYWDYYCYVKEHPVRRWDTPTSILCGGRDELCEPDVTARFARQYGCRLLTRPEAGHYFHTPKELEALRQWLTASL